MTNKTNKKQSMNRILMLVAMMPVLATADTTYTGLTEVTDVSTLNGADGNIVLGRGTLKDTGPSCRSGQSLSMASSKVPASTLRRTVRS